MLICIRWKSRFCLFSLKKYDIFFCKFDIFFALLTSNSKKIGDCDSNLENNTMKNKKVRLLLKDFKFEKIVRSDGLKNGEQEE